MIIASYMNLCQMVMNYDDMISSCISSIIDGTSGNISFHKESLMLGTNFPHQSWMLHPSTHLRKIRTTFGKTWALEASFSAHLHSIFKIKWLTFFGHGVLGPTSTYDVHQANPVDCRQHKARSTRTASLFSAQCTINRLTGKTEIEASAGWNADADRVLNES